MQLFRPLCSDARLPRFLYYHIYRTLDAICVCIFFNRGNSNIYSCGVVRL